MSDIWEVYPGLVIDPHGDVVQTGPKNALAQALVLTKPGDIVEVNGTLPHVDLALGPGYRNNEAVRPEPFDVTVVGVGDARVRGLSIAQSGGGVERLEMRGLTIDARGSQVGVIGYMDTKIGSLHFEDIDLLSDQWTKWGFRIHGWSQDMSFIDVRGWDGGQEHLFYVDHPRDYVLVRNCVGRRWRRTHTQVVTRKVPGSAGITRPAATGNCTIEGNEAYDCGQDGAFNFTVTGWPNGNVFFRKNHGESRFETGLFVSYYDIKQGDLVNPNGFQVSHLVWAHNVGIFPNGVREVNGIGSVEDLEVRVSSDRLSFNHSLNRGMDMEKNGKPCGTIELQSRYDPNLWNWQMPKPFCKHKKVLTEDEVRKLWPQP
jgi:hypothetical protein